MLFLCLNIETRVSIVIKFVRLHPNTLEVHTTDNDIDSKLVDRTASYTHTGQITVKLRRGSH